jgi:predicted metalloprotease
MKPPRRRLKKSVKRTLWGILLVIIVILFVHHHHAQKTTTTQSTAAKQTQTTPQKTAAKPATPTVKTTTAPTAQEKAAVRQKLTKKWQAILDQQTTKRPVSIAVYSKKYDETITLNSSKSSPHITASIIKVAMITQLLHKHKANNAKLSTAEISYAEGAIENSNNADATSLVSRDWPLWRAEHFIYQPRHVQLQSRR